MEPKGAAAFRIARTWLQKRKGNDASGPADAGAPEGKHRSAAVAQEPLDVPHVRPGACKFGGGTEESKGCSCVYVVLC